METKNIIARVNQILADEMLRYEELESVLDRTIDDINNALNSCYPSFSEYKYNDELKYDGKYSFFPDKYIRSVVIIGTAYYWYQKDEEGEQAASTLYSDYQRGLYLMTRDWLINVPEEFCNDKEGYSTLDFALNQGWGIDFLGDC